MPTNQDLKMYRKFQAASLPSETNENYRSHGASAVTDIWAFNREVIVPWQMQVQEPTNHERSACRRQLKPSQLSVVTLENYTQDTGAWTDQHHIVDCLILPFHNQETHVPDRARVLKYSKDDRPSNTAFGLLFSTSDGQLLPSSCARVIRRAKEHGLNEIAARLLTLWDEIPGENERDLDPNAADRFVTFMIATGATRPIVTADPLGRLDATWSVGDADRLVIRFWPTDGVSVAHKTSKTKGSFSSTLSEMIGDSPPLNLGRWIGG